MVNGTTRARNVNMEPVIAQKTDKEKEQENTLVLSYMTLRNLVGFVGFFLPLYLIIFTIVSPKESLPNIIPPGTYVKDTLAANDDLRVQGSMSDYYYTSSGDVFELALCTCCVLIMVYGGYNWMDRSLCYISALGGLGVAFDPTQWKNTCKISQHSIMVHPEDVWMVPGTKIEVHFVFAGIFLLGLAILCIKFFPLTHSDSTQSLKPGSRKTQKEKRNRIYKICGWTMVGSVVACILYCIFDKQIDPHIGKFPMIFFWETVALFAFAISWLTKGETLYPDGEHYMITGFKMAKQAMKKDKQTNLDLKK